MKYDTTDFQKDVIEASYSIPVLVDFWAEWCGPCRILGPVLERLAEKNQDRWKLVKLDTEQFPEIAAQYGIRSIPNVKLFVDGKVADEFVSALPENMIEQWLAKALPSKHYKAIQKAEELVSKNNTEAAKQLLEDVLKIEPDNDHARAILARIVVFSDPKRAEKLLEGIEEDSEYFDIVESIRSFTSILQSNNRAEQLPESPVKNRYFEAIQALRNQEFDRALEKFIDVIRTDRYYDNDNSRKTCIAIFKYLGEEHPVTLKHRRDFGRALYV